jgi:hypothetical protein
LILLVFLCFGSFGKSAKRVRISPPRPFSFFSQFDLLEGSFSEPRAHSCEDFVVKCGDNPPAIRTMIAINFAA